MTLILIQVQSSEIEWRSVEEVFKNKLVLSNTFDQIKYFICTLSVHGYVSIKSAPKCIKCAKMHYFVVFIH